MEEVVNDFGHLDVLVNNAGIRRRKPALEVTEEDWDAVVDTNLKGVFFCAQAAARPMIDQGGGRIINIASQMALVAREDRAAYCASKAGVANLTRVLALEWIKYGITVNAIGPGPTTTPGMLAADSRSPLGGRAGFSGQYALGQADGAGGTGGSGDLPGQPIGQRHHGSLADSGRWLDGPLV